MFPLGWRKLEQNFWLRSRHQERESLISGVEEKELSSQDLGKLGGAYRGEARECPGQSQPGSGSGLAQELARCCMVSSKSTELGV